MYRLAITIILLTFSGLSYSQSSDVIKLKNGSFEDFPRAGGTGGYNAPIKNWYDCGEQLFPNESAPDIHPIDFWQVTKEPVEGDTYLGLVVRDNESWESVAQRLSEPIEAGKCYTFSIYLARSDKYVSGSRATQKLENYTQPAVLQIYGGQGVCASTELLGKSEPVANYEWQKFDIEFSPKKEHRFIMLEAYYKKPVFFPYNGHILLDGASDITRIACPGEDYVAVAPPPKVEPKKPRKPKKEEPKEDIAASTPPPVKVEPTPVKKSNKPKILKELDRKTIQRGQTINIENLYFDANTSTIGQSSYPILDEVYEFLNDNQDIMVELGGHTNGVRGITHEFCDSLSTDRAKAVAAFLISKGIDSKQLKYKGYGKRKPIASNLSKEGRIKNQRVEIKILNI